MSHNHTQTKPTDLQNEQLWSTLYSENHVQWNAQLDKQLYNHVVQSTVSTDRFPAGVNWLEVAKAIGSSPVECVKRYAYLHHIQNQEELNSPEPNATDSLHSSSGLISHQTPLTLGICSSDEDITSPGSRSLLQYVTPVSSPRIHSLESSGDFAVPNSPPPFAVPSIKANCNTNSPIRWENMAKNTNAMPSKFVPPTIDLHRQFSSQFGTDDKRRILSTASPRTSPNTFVQILNQHAFSASSHGEELDLTNAVSELYLDDFSLPTGPLRDLSTPPSPLQFTRVTSHGDLPFISAMDSNKTKERNLALGVMKTSALGTNLLNKTQVDSPQSQISSISSKDSIPLDPRLMTQRQEQQQQMSIHSNVSSFHGDNPFSGSLTQSALEDAFLDMAGSRLDASSVLLHSNVNMSQLRNRMDQDKANQSS